MDNLKYWITNQCKFAQQQTLLPFENDEDFSHNPLETHENAIDEDIIPEPIEEFVQGYFHTTTNLPAVLSWGALKSRKQLDNAGGLGGGYDNQAPDKISLTFNYGKASDIFHGLVHAAMIATGQINASNLFAEFMDHVNLSYITNELEGILISQGVPRSVIRSENFERIDQILNKNVNTPEQCYEFLQSLDDSLLSSDSQEDVEARVGFTANWEQIKNLIPQNIAILKMEVRKGADYEYIWQEHEMRFSPEDVRLSPNAVVERG